MKKLYTSLLFLLFASSAFAQLVIPAANDGTTGTAVNETAIVNSTNNAITAGTSNTGVPTYIVAAGAGLLGQAQLVVLGPASCLMDSTIASGAAWYYVVNSTTTPGDCHAQAAAPAAATWVIGYLNASATTSGVTAQVMVASFVYGGGGSTTYPGAGVGNSTGSAWGTSYTVGTSANDLVQLDGSARLPAVNASLLTNFPTLNQSTTGNSATSSVATNLSGSGVDSAPYQSGSATTAYITAPTTSGHTFVYAWQPSGSAVPPGALDFTTFMASPPAIGGTSPSTGAFTSLTANSFALGSSPPTACGSATGCDAFKEASTAGTPTAGQSYVRADSTTHTIKMSVNGSSEATLTNGVPTFHLVQTPTSLTAQAANISNTTVYTPTPTSGWYRVCISETLTRAATTSSTLPGINFFWIDPNDSNTKSVNINDNTSNSTGTQIGQCIGPFLANNAALVYGTSNYASSGATTMQYDLQISVEAAQ